MTARTGKEHPRGTRARCPICRAPTEAAWKPFCSRRCADVDLGRWLTGGYAIPGEDAAEETPPSEQRSERGEE
jgi:endogenous inhibitor of DNA gyrase (YacG/DUF329 family)